MSIEVELKKRYYPNGNLESECEYVDGVHCGYYKNYYDDGNLGWVSYYKNDVQEGEQVTISVYHIYKPYAKLI